MNSEQLAKRVERTTKEACSRILGIGAEQYAQGDTQKFETMPFPELAIYYKEELLDQINYCVMQIIRIEDLAQRFNAMIRSLEGAGIQIRNVTDANSGSAYGKNASSTQSVPASTVAIPTISTE